MTTEELEHKIKNTEDIKVNSVLITEYTNIGITTAMFINTIKLQYLKNI